LNRNSERIPRCLAGSFNVPKGTLFNRVNEVDPLTCPKCKTKISVVAFIEDPDVVKKILRHLNLWEFRQPPRLVAHAPPEIETPLYDNAPHPSVEAYVADPVYPIDANF